MNQVIVFLTKVFSIDIVDSDLELKKDREYIIKFGASIKNARKRITITDYSVSKEEQLLTKSCEIDKAGR